MALNFTYDDFTKAVANAGLDINNISAADLALAKQNPEAGMSLVSYWKDYNNATTDEARALAHQGAENIRNSYGNYSGGGNGGTYYDLGKQENDVDAALDAVSNYGTYTSQYNDQIADLLSKAYNYGDYSSNYSNDIAELLTKAKNYGDYTSNYSDQIADLLTQANNYGDFTYDPTTDVSYQSAKKAAARESARATENTLGQLAAQTGGQASTAAVNSASQAGDYYLAQFADNIPTYEQNAYSRYLDTYNRILQNLSNYQTQDNTEYNRYLDDYSRILSNLTNYQNQDATEYSRYLDDYSRLLSNLSAYQTQDSTEYGRWTDAYNMLQNNLENRIAERDTQNTLKQQAYENALNTTNLFGSVQNESDATALGTALGALTSSSQSANQSLISTLIQSGDLSSVTDEQLQAAGFDPTIARALAAAYAKENGTTATGTNPDATPTPSPTPTETPDADKSVSDWKQYIRNSVDAGNDPLVALSYINSKLKAGSLSITSAQYKELSSYAHNYANGTVSDTTDTTSSTTSNTLDAATKKSIFTTYPTGVVTNPADWQSILSYTGMDATELAANGITYKAS